jgi:hypothetical protein
MLVSDGLCPSARMAHASDDDPTLIKEVHTLIFVRRAPRFFTRACRATVRG